MADIYSKEAALLHDYKKLSQEYKNKAGRYIKNLLRIQRAENDVQKKLCLFNKSVDTEGILDEVNCSFCGKSQHDDFALLQLVLMMKQFIFVMNVQEFVVKFLMKRKNKTNNALQINSYF